MGMTKKQFIEDLKLNGLCVLTRVDFNVPLNEDLQIGDNGRSTDAGKYSHEGLFQKS